MTIGLFVPGLKAAVKLSPPLHVNVSVVSAASTVAVVTVTRPVTLQVAPPFLRVTVVPPVVFHVIGPGQGVEPLKVMVGFVPVQVKVSVAPVIVPPNVIVAPVTVIVLEPLTVSVPAFGRSDALEQTFGFEFCQVPCHALLAYA